MLPRPDSGPVRRVGKSGRCLRSGWGSSIELAADDVSVRNFEPVKRGIAEDVASAAPNTLNQIGKSTETMSAIHLARQVGWGEVVSHRSGKMLYYFIPDLTTAAGTDHWKAGGPCRG